MIFLEDSLNGLRQIRHRLCFQVPYSLYVNIVELELEDRSAKKEIISVQKLVNIYWQLLGLRY